MEPMITIAVAVLTGLLGFVSGIGLEKYRFKNATQLQELQAKHAKDGILYGKRCEFYGKLSLALGDFQGKVCQMSRLLSGEESTVESVINEIEAGWTNLIRTVNEGEGYYSSSVKSQVDKYLGLPCWKDLRTENLTIPASHKIADPVDFVNKVFNQLFAKANYTTIRDAIERDLNQQPPVKYVIKYKGED